MLSNAGGLPGAYAPGALNAVCGCCTRFDDALPTAWLLVARQIAQYVASGRLRLQEFIPKSFVE